jgi:hypothetical protein
MASSVEDILNQALGRIGNETPIGYIWEGSKASRRGLEIYGQTRDVLLREKDWAFARRQVLASIAGAAPYPWNYEYSWPSDCLRLRNIIPVVAAGLVLDPRPSTFSVFNNGSAKTILAMTTPIILVYSGQITDMTTWEPSFTEALVEALARRLVVSITGSADLLKDEAGLSGGALEMAAEVQENRPPRPMQQREAQ